MAIYTGTIDTYIGGGSVDDFDISTWYGLEIGKSVWEDEGFNESDAETLANSYLLETRIVELSDLQNLNISVDLPDGKTAYAKNFKVSKVSGKWQLTAEFSNIVLANISDGESDYRYYDWSASSTSVIPDSFQNKEFIFTMYIDMKEHGAARTTVK
jgi:hypothetical protein